MKGGSLTRSWLVFTLLILAAGFSPLCPAGIVDIQIVEHGTGNNWAILPPNETITVDVLATVHDPASAVSAFQMELYDAANFGSGTPTGVNVQSVQTPMGWVNLSTATYPVPFTNLITADAYSSASQYDLTGPGCVLTSLALQAPPAAPFSQLFITLYPNPAPKLFDQNGDDLTVGQISGLTLIPEPVTLALLLVGAGSIMRSRGRRWG